MGTRSRIAVMHGDKCKSVYCHWDGYPDYVGRILLNHYDSAKANQLVALGDISSLGPEIGEEHPFSRFDTDISDAAWESRYGNMTTFYGRDRGETGTEFKVAHTFDEFYDQVDACGGEWYYVMRDGAWYVGNTYSVGYRNKLVPLADALADQDIDKDDETESVLIEQFVGALK